MRRYNLKPKVAIHCKTQAEASAIKAIFSDPSYRNERGKFFETLSDKWSIYKENTILLPHSGMFGKMDTTTNMSPYWTETIEATTIIDYVYDGDSVLMGAQANFTNLRPEKAKPKDGEVYTYIDNPYGVIGMLFKTDKILVLRSNNKSLFTVGQTYTFNPSTWSLVDDMELSLKLKQ